MAIYRGTDTTFDTGEANTNSNAGNGEGLVKPKVGVDTPIKSLTSSDGSVDISSNDDEVDLRVGMDTSDFLRRVTNTPVGTGQSIISNTGDGSSEAVLRGIKSSDGTVNVSISADQADIDLSVPPVAAGVNTLNDTSVLTAPGRFVVDGPTGDVLIKRLGSDDGSVTITNNQNYVDLSVPSSGETNTASNSGTGVGLSLPKNGVDLPFRTIKSGSENLKVRESTSGDEIILDLEQLGETPYRVPATISYPDATPTAQGDLQDTSELGVNATKTVFAPVAVPPPYNIVRCTIPAEYLDNIELIGLQTNDSSGYEFDISSIRVRYQGGSLQLINSSPTLSTIDSNGSGVGSVDTKLERYTLKGDDRLNKIVEIEVTLNNHSLKNINLTSIRINGVSAPFKGLESTDGSVTITENTGSFDLSVPAVSGEANTNSNAGNGEGLVLPKQGVDTPIKSLTSSDGSVTITGGADTIDLVVPQTGSSTESMVFDADLSFGGNITNNGKNWESTGANVNFGIGIVGSPIIRGRHTFTATYQLGQNERIGYTSSLETNRSAGTGTWLGNRAGEIGVYLNPVANEVQVFHNGTQVQTTTATLSNTVQTVSLILDRTEQTFDVILGGATIASVDLAALGVEMESFFPAVSSDGSAFTNIQGEIQANRYGFALDFPTTSLKILEDGTVAVVASGNNAYGVADIKTNGPTVEWDLEVLTDITSPYVRLGVSPHKALTPSNIYFGGSGNENVSLIVDPGQIALRVNGSNLNTHPVETGKGVIINQSLSFGPGAGNGVYRYGINGEFLGEHVLPALAAGQKWRPVMAGNSVFATLRLVGTRFLKTL